MMKPTAGKSEHTRDMACQLTQEERELWICGQLSASPPPFSLRVGNMTRCSQRWATHMILRSELTTYPQLPPPPFSWKGGKRTEPLTAVRNSRDPEVGNKMTLDIYLRGEPLEIKFVCAFTAPRDHRLGHRSGAQPLPRLRRGFGSCQQVLTSRCSRGTIDPGYLSENVHYHTCSTSGAARCA